MSSSSPFDRSAAAILARHDPTFHTKPFARRPDSVLPFDIAAIPGDWSIMPDTGFYIDRLKGKLPAAIMDFVDGMDVLHSGVACSELAISVGILTPDHPTTPAYRDPLLNLLAAIDLDDAVAPSAEAWCEAGILAGILARTQHLNRSRKKLTPEEDCCQKGKRRKLLNDALVFLSAVESNAILLTGNVVDIDLLLRFKPAARVLLYRPN